MAISIPKQSKAFSKKVQEATYFITELTFLKRKSHTDNETNMQNYSKQNVTARYRIKNWKGSTLKQYKLITIGDIPHEARGFI